MFWKDELASYILQRHQEGELTFQELSDLRLTYPSLQVKTIDAKGTICVIRLSGREQWIKPHEWASNHFYSVVERLREGQQRVSSMCNDLAHWCDGSCKFLTAEANSTSSNDLAIVEDLERSRNKWREYAYELHNQLQLSQKFVSDFNLKAQNSKCLKRKKEWLRLENSDHS